MASVIAAGTTSGTSLNLSADTSGVLQLATNGTTTAVTIDTGQNVGIGTASPTNKLHVQSANSEAINISDSAAGGNAQIKFTGSRTYQVGVGNASSGFAGALYFYDATAAAERMRITSSGDVGIGTTTIGAALTVAKSNSYAGGLLLGQAAVASGYLWTTDNLYIKPNTSANTASGSVLIQNFAGSANQISLSAVNGLIAIGGATPAATGAGITFPATQSASSDANTLDDYEEGTFTPTAFGAGSAGTTTYTTQAGTYTKIGRQVTITFAINYTALTGTGELRYGNFPFTSGAPEFIGAIMTNGLNWSGGTSIVLYVVPNSTNGVIFGSTDDSGWSPQQCVNESADMRCTVTYFV